jgi:hypothetical protein
MSRLLHFGEVIAVNANLFPDKIGARDLARSLTFRAWNERSCRLANALRGLGLDEGDRIAILAYNCLEWMEIYAAIAKSGLVLVPINFRLIGSEIGYTIENSEAKAIIVQHDLIDRLDTVRDARLIPEPMYNISAALRRRGVDPTRILSRRRQDLNPRSIPGRMIPMLFSTPPEQPVGPRASSAIAVECSFRPIWCRQSGGLAPTIPAFWSCRCAMRIPSISPTSWPGAARPRASTTGRPSSRIIF